MRAQGDRSRVAPPVIGGPAAATLRKRAARRRRATSAPDRERTMTPERIAAFSSGAVGGNPAGVVVCDAMPEPAAMQRLAAEIGYSETAFAAPEGDAWRVRYFAPAVEVDFCGHATIALAAALARRRGSGAFTLQLNRARITVKGRCSDGDWGASFVSPPTRSAPVAPDVLAEALALFGLAPADLDGRIPPAVAHGGGDHLVLALGDRGALAAMRYDLEAGRALAAREGFVTFALVHAKTPRLFHARNAFPIGGVREDPATGAAAAALAGYLRDLGWPHEGAIAIRQGEDMGVPCRLDARITPERGAGIEVSGTVREIGDA
jgi:PhzF family phenazine biosynthesis protein